MSKKAFKAIAAALREALAVARGEEEAGEAAPAQVGESDRPVRFAEPLVRVAI
jgi:hypothetical protein